MMVVLGILGLGFFWYFVGELRRNPTSFRSGYVLLTGLIALGIGGLFITMGICHHLYGAP
jgi:hypothetical protein